MVFLDGLRGWAALAVLLGHVAEAFPEIAFLLYTPLRPLLLDGKFSVYIFFVLSGIVLSANYLQCGQRRLICALAIKRLPRLSIPIFFSCMIIVLLMKNGLFFNHAAAAIQERMDFFTQKQISWIEKPFLGTFYNFDVGFVDALRFAFRDVFFDYKADHSYNTPLWTMSGEIAGSFLVAMTLFCSKYIKSGAYVFWILTAAFFFMVNGILFAFMLGIAASYLYINKKDFIQKIEKSIFLKALLFFVTAAMYSAALISSYLRINRAMELLYSVAAFMLIMLLFVIPPAQRVFSTRIFRFLGKISFPLYIVHTPVLCSFSSFLIVKYASAGVFSWIFPALSVIVSLAAACAFYPVEYAAIKLSNKLSCVIKKQ
jgi:peptidoglycan/LPS O-acetylase OafA/YrhL